MKPSKNDIAIKIKISGRKLDELQKHTALMCESFGLDNKIFNYKGKRPIKLYHWDLDCLLSVLEFVLKDETEYPDKKDEGYLQLQQLYLELQKLALETYGT